jgi:hypothetical protein
MFVMRGSPHGAGLGAGSADLQRNSAPRFHDRSVAKVNSAGLETALHDFSGAPDGNQPFAGVTLDAAGNIYGTTDLGGKQQSGVVFKLTPQ